METRPTQSQMFNINNVSSPKDSTSGQCGGNKFMHIQKCSYREGIPEQRVVFFCLVKPQDFFLPRMFKDSNLCTNKKKKAFRDM